MTGIRRKNISENRKQEVRTLHFEKGWTVPAIYTYCRRTPMQISKSSIYKIIAEENKATRTQPHHRMLRSLTESWLQEIRELNPIRLVWQLVELTFSAGGLLDLAQKTDVKKDLETQEVQPDARASIGRWRANVHKDLHFRSLQEHLAGYSVWRRYEEIEQATYEIFSTLFYQIAPHVQFLVGGCVGNILGDTWVERLKQDAGLREITASITRHAFFLASLELTRLAIRGRTTSTELDSLKWVVEQALPEAQHNLALSCSLIAPGSWSDRLLDSVRTGWADGGWDVIKTAMARTLDLWFNWQKAKDMVIKDLEAVANQDPFPGRCADCT